MKKNIFPIISFIIFILFINSAKADVELIKPQNESIIKNRLINFSWNPDERDISARRGVYYIIQAADNKDFNPVLYMEKTLKTETEFSFQPGQQYYWRVGRVIRDEIKFGSSYIFTVGFECEGNIKNITLLETFESYKKIKLVFFEKPSNSDIEFEISETPDFKNIIVSAKTSNTQAVVTVNMDNFFIRTRVINPVYPEKKIWNIPEHFTLSNPDESLKNLIAYNIKKNLKAEMEKLKSDNEHLNSLVFEKNKNIETLNKIKNEQEEEIKKKNEILLDLQMKQKKYEDEMIELNKYAATEKIKINDINSLKRNLFTVHKELNNLRLEKKESDEKIKELSNQNSELSKKNDILNKSLDSVKQKETELLKTNIFKDEEIEKNKKIIASQQETISKKDLEIQNLYSDYSKSSELLKIKDSKIEELNIEITNLNKLVLLRDRHITDLSEKIDSTSSKQKENEIRILEAEKEISGYKNKVAELYETVKMKDLEVNSIIKDKYDLIEKIDKMTKNENMGSNILKNTNLSKTNNQNDDNKKIDERQLLSSKYDYLKQLLSESISLFKNNDYDNALLKLEEALSIDKNNDEVCFNIAAVYYAQKKYEHALDFIDKAILINPSNIENKIYKAAMLVKMQDKIEFNKFIKTLNEKEIQHNKISYYIKLMR